MIIGHNYNSSPCLYYNIKQWRNLSTFGMVYLSIRPLRIAMIANLGMLETGFPIDFSVRQLL